MHSRLGKHLYDAVILFDLHEGFQVNVGHGLRGALDPYELRDVPDPEKAPPYLPVALSDGRLLIQFPPVVAEGALEVAPVGLPYGVQTAVREARAASVGDLFGIPHEKAASPYIVYFLQLAVQLPYLSLLGVLDLAEHVDDYLLLPGEQLLVAGQGGKKFEPHEGVFLRNLHKKITFFSLFSG